MHKAASLSLFIPDNHVLTKEHKLDLCTACGHKLGEEVQRVHRAFRENTVAKFNGK
jgi:hypothetical protein